MKSPVALRRIARWLCLGAALPGLWIGLLPRDAWALTPPHHDLTVRLDMASSIRGLESPSHPLAIEIDGASATVRLGDRRAAPDSDFVLLVRLQEPYEPRASLEERNGEAVAMVAFQPRFESRESASEVIPPSTARARWGLDCGELETPSSSVSSRREGSWFNVTGRPTHEMLFPESCPSDEASFRQATEHAGARSEPRGTEILPPSKRSSSRRPSVSCRGS
jgi:hypothetical protein